MTTTKKCQGSCGPPFLHSVLVRRGLPPNTRMRIIWEPWMNHSSTTPNTRMRRECRPPNKRQRMMPNTTTSTTPRNKNLQRTRRSTPRIGRTRKTVTPRTPSSMRRSGGKSVLMACLNRFSWFKLSWVGSGRVQGRRGGLYWQ